MIAVRPFEPADAPALVALMLEMTRFYGVTVAPERDIAAEVTAGAASVETILAFRKTALVGFATFAFLFPVDAARTLAYVHQIYVGEAGRRVGVGTRLLAEIARTAKARGCERMEWSTGADNHGAQAMYDGLGAVSYPKVHYVLDGAAFERLGAR